MKCILGGGETHGLTQKWAFGQTADLKKKHFTFRIFIYLLEYRPIINFHLFATIKNYYESSC